VPDTRHPVADRDDIVLVHVTPFNALMWDAGRAPSTVIEHGIVDPGYRYTGDLDRAAVVLNEPVRRWRVTGTDLLPRFAEVAGLDVFGMGLDGLAERLGLSTDRLRAIGDLRTAQLHEEMARRRFYLHPVRWTSLGLSLLEAMHLGMPVIALATTEVGRAVPPDAGVAATDVDELVHAARDLTHDRDRARCLGRRAREFALSRYGLAGFLDRWNVLIDRLTSDGGGT
jgi:glycosyltransferase involved in cell wall biosynthesis